MTKRYDIVIWANKIIGLFVRNPPILSSKECKKHFKGSEELEKNWKVIRKEALDMMKQKNKIPKLHEVSEIWKRFSEKGEDAAWRTFVFKFYGNYNEKNCKLCPNTSNMIKKMPNVTTAMFSILEGKKHIQPHHGAFKGVFRYHLGLVVPKDKPCFIEVGGEKYIWKEGKGVLFDDTFLHQVWNKSNKRRIVLFLDIDRNDWPFWLVPLKKIIAYFISSSKLTKDATKRAEVQIDLK